MTFSRATQRIMQASVLSALLTFGHVMGATACVDPREQTDVPPRSALP